MSPPDGEAPLRIYHPVSAGLIAVGLERTAPGPSGHCFACSKGNGALLAYYFGKGGREVLVRHAVPPESITLVTDESDVAAPAAGVRLLLEPADG